MASTNFVSMTVQELCNYSDEIQGEWNGDEPGVQEDRAMAAKELFTTLSKAYGLYKELEEL